MPKYTEKVSQGCESIPKYMEKVSQGCESMPKYTEKVSLGCESMPKYMEKVSQGCDKRETYKKEKMPSIVKDIFSSHFTFRKGRFFLLRYGKALGNGKFLGRNLDIFLYFNSLFDHSSPANLRFRLQWNAFPKPQRTLERLSHLCQFQ